jgi:alpha,alpha-trehalase
MFEKFSIRDVDSSGRGGEYTVQAGFGWTNGVVLWVASTFGKQLVAPMCPDPLFAANDAGSTSNTGNSSSSSSGGGGSSSPKKSSALQINVAQCQLFGLALFATALQFLAV